jgi:hypothetical protein
MIWRKFHYLQAGLGGGRLCEIYPKFFYLPLKNFGIGLKMLISNPGITISLPVGEHRSDSNGAGQEPTIPGGYHGHWRKEVCRAQETFG